MYKSLQSAKLDIDEGDMENEQIFCLDTESNDASDDIETGDIDNDPEPVSNSKSTQKYSKEAQEGEEEIVVSHNYMFTGFMSFMVWGAFAEPKDRLSLFNTGDANKGAVNTRKRKADKLLKDKIRKDDKSNQRGLTRFTSLEIFIHSSISSNVNPLPRYRIAPNNNNLTFDDSTPVQSLVDHLANNS